MREDRTRRALAVLGSVIFLLAAPGTVMVLVPWWITSWQVHAPFPGFALLRSVGALLILAGSFVVLDSFARFALEGLGTPAPVAPPRRLVATGLYRYVRNPMYVTVVSAIVGQALFFGSLRLLAYGALVAVIVHLFVVAYEEPKLRATFGDEYEAFCASVPRWLPRLRPRTGQTARDGEEQTESRPSGGSARCPSASAYREGREVVAPSDVLYLSSLGR